MKDLDETQVYDLRGITEEQAKELYEWLRCYDRWRDRWEHRYIIEGDSLEYYTEWLISNRKPTTHISTLFEPTYEQQLQEAKKKLEHYKKEVERLENKIRPNINDVCKFWDNDESVFAIGTLSLIDDSDVPYNVGDSAWFKNAIKVTEQEVIDLLFKKS